jgi:hypothetical protein
MTDWLSVQQGFNPDGALRDVYIAPASASLWNEFIEWVPRAGYRSEFWHGQSKKTLPPEFQEIKRLQLTDPTILKLFLSCGVQINCHFFTDEEIEMDVDPTEIQDQESFENLLEFLRALARALKRDARVTYENSPDDEIFVVECV